MEKRKKSSIVTTIIISFLVFSIIWVCFIMGRIEHGKPEKDEFNISYKENDDDVIDDGGIIVFAPEEENEDSVKNEVEENVITNIVKNTSINKRPNYSSTNSQNQQSNNLQENTNKNDKVEPFEPIVPQEPEIPEKPNTPIIPEEPEEPEKPNDPIVPEEPEKPEEPEIDRTGTYWVEDKEIVWENNSILGIFKNPKYNMRNIIAPGSTNSYVFYVSNKMGFDLNYIINFSEENDMKVNMMYKLKRENEYIIGDENTWVYYDQLHIDYNIENEGKDKYVLEWKWVDSDNDTEVGINHAGEIYKLKIDICATQISGFEEETPETDSGESSENDGITSDDSTNQEDILTPTPEENEGSEG